MATILPSDINPGAAELAVKAVDFSKDDLHSPGDSSNGLPSRSKKPDIQPGVTSKREYLRPA